MLVNKPSTYCLRARWIVPVCGPPVEGGAVVVEGNKIAAILSTDESLASIETTDYGEAVITPGFFNLHTHLDYTDLRHFQTEAPFLEWIEELISRSWSWTAEQWRDSALRGAAELALSGTTFAADASYSGAAAHALARVGLRATVGLELFGVNESKAEMIWQQWLDKYARFIREAPAALREAVADGRITLTVAPHTPYTVCPALINRALEWAEDRSLPVLIHVAESDMECRWLDSSYPALDTFLAKATGESPDELARLAWRGRGYTPVRHLKEHNLLRGRILAAHAVKLQEEDIAILAKAGAGIAHCPRSNSRLGNGIAPLARLIEAGLNVGLGTDSAASSDDLDVLCELRFACNLHRAVNPEFNLSPADAINHVTLSAAKAVGLDSLCGSLAPGKLADLAVFSLEQEPEAARANPLATIVYGRPPVIDVFVDGKPVVKAGELANIR